VTAEVLALMQQLIRNFLDAKFVMVLQIFFQEQFTLLVMKKDNATATNII
jgi:hypothetical protein